MKVITEKSQIHGKGLFAKKQIKIGEIIFIAKGKEIKILISDEEKAKVASMDWFAVGKNKWIEPTKSCAFINHSCNPNCGIRGKLTFVVLKNIKKGEEITFDYSLNEADIFWNMKCKCHSEKCREIIKSIQFLPQKKFERSIQHIPKYFQMIFKRFKLDNFKNQKELRTSWVNFIKKDFE